MLNIILIILHKWTWWRQHCSLCKQMANQNAEDVATYWSFRSDAVCCMFLSAFSICQLTSSLLTFYARASLISGSLVFPLCLRDGIGKVVTCLFTHSFHYVAACVHAKRTIVAIILIWSSIITLCFPALEHTIFILSLLLWTGLGQSALETVPPKQLVEFSVCRHTGCP